MTYFGADEAELMTSTAVLGLPLTLLLRWSIEKNVGQMGFMSVMREEI